jgi:hypothetical protein
VARPADRHDDPQPYFGAFIAAAARESPRIITAEVSYH